MPAPRLTAAALRCELNARALAWAEQHPTSIEQTPALSPSIVFASTPEGLHGNFLPASWRRIARHPAWLSRLSKAYTASRNLPWSSARRRGELEAATSSDALLMNVFCYPGLLRRSAVCALLGTDPGLRPRFGVRLRTPLGRGLLDRTEADLLLGDLLLESKLTETSFQTAPLRLLTRYPGLETVFEPADLPRLGNGHIAGYQLIRSVLAAHARECRFAVLSDARRHDLTEQWFLVLRAVRSADLRSRLQLITWQELSRVAPPRLQRFLAARYGIDPA